MTDHHARFASWLVEGGGTAPRDLAVHAVVCRECTALASGVDALHTLELDATVSFEAPAVEAPAAVPPAAGTAPASARWAPQLRQIAVAGAALVVVGGVITGAAALRNDGRLNAAGEPSLTPHGEVLSRISTPRPRPTPSSAPTDSQTPEPRPSTRTRPSREPSASRPPRSPVPSPLTIAGPAPPPAPQPAPLEPPPPDPTPAAPPPPPGPVLLGVRDAGPAAEGTGAPGETTAFTFVVELSRAAPGGGVTFSYATSSSQPAPPQGGESAVAGSSCALTEDYLAGTGSVMVPAGESAVALTVSVCADALLESDEYFALVISGASANASVSDGVGYGLIVDDEPGNPVSSVLPGGAT